MQYIFVSYSRTDSGFVLKLVEDLKKLRFNIWLDQLDIPPGMPWDDAIDQALLESSHMILVISPESVKSQNVRDELGYARDNKIDIIPIYYRPAQLPLRLSRLQYIDFRTKNYDSVLSELSAKLPLPDAMPSLRIHDAIIRNVAIFAKQPITASNIDKVVLLTSLESKEGSVWAVAFDPNPTVNMLAFTGNDGLLSLWEMDSGRILPAGQFSSIWSMSFSRDGKLIAAACDDKTAIVLDVDGFNIKFRARLREHRGLVFWVALNANTDMVATGGEDGMVRVFSTAGKLLHSFDPGLDCQIYNLAFHPMINLLYSVGEDQLIYEWDVDSDMLHRKWRASQLPIYAIAVSHEGSLIATGGGDRTLRVWRSEDTRQICELSGPKGSIMSLSFSFDNSVIAAGCADGSIWLWNTKNYQLLETYDAHPGLIIYNISFSGDGTMLLSCSSDGSVQIRGISQ